MKRIAIITTHPIQYNAPWFKLLAERKQVALKVFYTWGQLAAEKKYDPGFGKNVDWDIPLLDGYDYSFVKNISASPGSHHFNGIDNPSLITAIKEWAPDAILVFGWSFKSHLKVIRYFKGRVAVLFRGDSTLLDEKMGPSFKKLLRRIFLTWVYKQVDKALYVGSANKSYYLQHGLTASQLIFAPHAIDNDRFKTGGQINKREALGISGADIVFLFTGKMEAKKDPLLLVNSFIALNHPAAHLLLVGNGNLDDQLKALVEEQAAAIKSRIHFLPFQNQLEMPAIYKTADIFVLPSQGPGETWGLAVNEAMACGKAVLASDKCGCAQDLVKEGTNGYIFKSKDADDLKNKMAQLVSDHAAVKEMGKQSLQIIDNWRYEKICAAIEQVVG